MPQLVIVDAKELIEAFLKLLTMNRAIATTVEFGK
jgi:hypothetical protein